MKFISQAVKIILALYLVMYIADQLLVRGQLGHYMISILLVALIYFFYIPWKYKFILFSLLIFFPFTFPRNFPLPFKYMSEIVSPILFIFLAFEIWAEKKAFFSKKASIFFVAIGIITLWALLSYIKTPVVGRTFGASSVAQLGLRTYVLILTGTSTFFVGFWFFRYKEINVERWLLLLLGLALIIGNLRILGFNIPLLSNFSGVASETKRYAATDGLRVTSKLGITALVGFYYKKKLGFYPVFAFVNCIVFAILSGGRGMFWGIIFALCLYVILIKRKNIIPVLAVFILVGGMYYLFSPSFSMDDSRYGRVFSSQDKVLEENMVRYYIYLYMWEVFKTSPVFGKGIGYSEISASDEFFVNNPDARHMRIGISHGLASGSHGSYMSILSTFGIGGFFYLMVMVFGTIYYAYTIVRRNGENQDDVRAALYIFMHMSVMSVHMFAGGTGLNYGVVWFLAGIIAGIMARQGDNPGTSNEKERVMCG